MSDGAETLLVGIAVDTPAGRVAVNPADIITFPHGLPGFEGCQRFVLVAPPALAPFTWLQGLDGAAPAFLTIDPRAVASHFTATLTSPDRVRLGVDATATCLWLAIVRVEGEALSANLAAPIVINPTRMVGLQAVGTDSAFGADHPIALAA